MNREEHRHQGRLPEQSRPIQNSPVPSVEDLEDGEIGRILRELAQDQGLQGEKALQFERAAIVHIRKLWPRE